MNQKKDKKVGNKNTEMKLCLRWVLTIIVLGIVTYYLDDVELPKSLIIGIGLIVYTYMFHNTFVDSRKYYKKRKKEKEALKNGKK